MHNVVQGVLNIELSSGCRQGRLLLLAIFHMPTRQRRYDSQIYKPVMNFLCTCASRDHKHAYINLLLANMYAMWRRNRHRSSSAEANTDQDKCHGKCRGKDQSRQVPWQMPRQRPRHMP